MEKSEETEVEKNVTENQEQEKKLTDDELYAQIQTEKLLKKKKTRKIVTFSGLCIALALAICLIVLAVVPVSLKPRCAVGGFSEVELYHGESIVGRFDDKDLGKDKFDLFLKKYNESFNTTYLSAIFSGSLFSYTIDENLLGAKSDSNVTDEEYENAYDLADMVENAPEYYAKLKFDSDRKFLRQNGSVFKSKYGSSGNWDGSLTYKYVFVAINQTKASHVTFYILGKSPQKQSDDKNYHVITVDVKADTSQIYSVWSQFTA